MTFKAQNLSSIFPILQAGSSYLVIEMELTEKQANDLFSLIWERLGDGWLKQRLTTEDFKLTN